MLKFKAIKIKNVIARQLNGKFVMLGFITLAGANFTTYQFIPRLIYSNGSTY